jgi:hypothetical protein
VSKTPFFFARFWGNHGDDYENRLLMACDVMRSVRNSLAILKNIAEFMPDYTVSDPVNRHPTYRFLSVLLDWHSLCLVAHRNFRWSELLLRLWKITSWVSEHFIYCTTGLTQLIPLAARTKARVCRRSLAGIAGSNPVGAWIFVSCECCVLCR